MGSRLGAIASRQSTVLASRSALEQEVEALRVRHADGNVIRPDWWGGYRVSPLVIEFWQGRQDRLHDRLRYTRKKDRWIIERLSP
jgi:pyridoxamine 5'-phosphate oxidase